MQKIVVGIFVLSALFLGLSSNANAAISAFASGDTLWVGQACATLISRPATQRGQSNCMDSVLKVLGKKGGTLVIMDSSVITNLSLDSASNLPLLITSDKSTAPGAAPTRYADKRGVLKSSTGGLPALSIPSARSNVTIKGLLIEMPIAATSPAVNIGGGGVVTLVGNIFRPGAIGANVNVPAINIINGVTQPLRIISNVFIGFNKNIQVSGTTTSDTVKILNNTFIDDATTPVSSGINTLATSMSASISNNYFSGIKDPYDASLSGKKIILKNNAYSSAPNRQGITESPVLDLARSLDVSSGFRGLAYLANLESAFAKVMDCQLIGSIGCSSLFAGSNATDTVATDYRGLLRSSKSEVGAFEYQFIQGNPKPLLGKLSLSVQNAGEYSRLKFTVVSNNFDPADADSVAVWWATRELDSYTDATTDKKVYPLAKLNSGSIIDSAQNLIDATKYFFRAAFVVSPSSIGHRDSVVIVTLENIISGGECKINGTKDCPPAAQSGYFKPAAPFDKLIKSNVIFNKPATNGIVASPIFTTVPTGTVVHGISLSTIPKISTNITENDLTNGSDQGYRIEIQFDSAITTAGLELFKLNASGLPTLMPEWKMENISANSRKLTIYDQEPGASTYAFGLPTASSGGKIDIVSKGALTPILTDSMVSNGKTIPFDFSGTGFITANPLILVNVIPAGGVTSASIYSKAFSIISNNKIDLITSSFISLGDSLKRSRLAKYLVKAGIEDITNPGDSSQIKKPFALNPSLPEADFSDVINTRSKALVISPTGDLTSDNISILIKPSNFSVAFATTTSTGAVNSGKMRSFEVVFTVFDGGKVSRSTGYIRRQVVDDVPADEKKGYDNAKWNLFAYPWQEAETGILAKIFASDSWDINSFAIWKYNPSSFIKYTGATAHDGVTFHSGNAIWTASLVTYTPKSTLATSLDYQTFSLPLPAAVWTDFGLPFNFKMRWKNIHALSAGDVVAYHYDIDNKAWRIVADGDILSPWEGYTAKSAAGGSLSFPVLDVNRAVFVAAKKSTQGWSANIKAFNSSASMYLGIGKNANTEIIGEAPLVPNQNFYASLKNGIESKQTFSRMIQSGEGMQGSWLLDFKSLQKDEAVNFVLEDNIYGIPVSLVDINHQIAYPLTVDSAVTLSAADLKKNTYQIVSGDAKSVLTGFASLSTLNLTGYPNPFLNQVQLHYALPIDQSSDMVLKIFDAKGKQVWTRTFTGQKTLDYVWDGRDNTNNLLPKGLYNLSLEATNAKGKYKALKSLIKL